MCMLSWALPFALPALLFAVPEQAREQGWKNKPISEWTESDAKAVMADSPWVKTVTPTLDKQSPPGGGIRIGGLGHRNAGHLSDSTTPSISAKPLTLTLRWESALPMREAELKAHDTGAPDLDDGYYAIAVYGFPRGMVADDSKQAADSLKRQAVLKRNAKKDIKPARVHILLREDGPVVVYLFAKSGEFTWRDHIIEFDAQVAQWKFTQLFSTDDMMFQGNLEL
jgi:hypothetical protein